MPVLLSDLGLVCALGNNQQDVLSGLLQPGPVDSWLTADTQLNTQGKRVMVGKVTTGLPDIGDMPVRYHSRNNQLAMAAWQQIEPTVAAYRQQHPDAVVAVVLGTSTSGIAEGEQALAYQHQHHQWPEDFTYNKQEMAAPAQFIAHLSLANGPVYTISTACTSSAKAMTSAKMLLEQQLADLVICGGADTLSQLPVNGFMSLESVSASVCSPFSAQRDGINLGEAAALFVMQRGDQGIALTGVGESVDAHHISSPDPSGAGAVTAMQQALTMAGHPQVDYLNAHGTGTIKNDQMESLAINQVFGHTLPCSSTKHLTGHTLGAAGALEAALCYLLLQQQNTALPANRTTQAGPDIAPVHLSGSHRRATVNCCMTNSFAFGGNNIALILERL